MRKRPLPEKAGMRLGERAGCKERETGLQVSDSLFCTICSGGGDATANTGRFDGKFGYLSVACPKYFSYYMALPGMEDAEYDVAKCLQYAGRIAGKPKNTLCRTAIADSLSNRSESGCVPGRVQGRCPASERRTAPNDVPGSTGNTTETYEKRRQRLLKRTAGRGEGKEPPRLKELEQTLSETEARRRSADGRDSHAARGAGSESAACVGIRGRGPPGRSDPHAADGKVPHRRFTPHVGQPIRNFEYRFTVAAEDGGCGGRHSRGRPPGPGSSCRSGGSGGKSGRGKEGSPPGGLRPAGGISSGRVPGCRAENPAIRHAAKNRNVSRRSGNLKIIKTKIKLTSALFGSVADPIGKKGERLRSGRALTRRPRLWMPGHSPAAVRRTTARRRNRPRRR